MRRFGFRGDMAKTPRSLLRKALQAYMIPAFEQRGFKIIPLDKKELSDRETRVILPFGHLRRVREDESYELVDIELAPHGDAGFRISFGVVPREGINSTSGQIMQDRVLIGWLNLHWNLYHNPRRWKWFKVRRWPWQQESTEEDQVALVKGVIDLIPEIEQVFQGGKPGPHVRTIDRHS